MLNDEIYIYTHKFNPFSRYANMSYYNHIVEFPSVYNVIEEEDSVSNLLIALRMQEEWPQAQRHRTPSLLPPRPSR